MALRRCYIRFNTFNLLIWSIDLRHFDSEIKQNHWTFQLSGRCSPKKWSNNFQVFFFTKCLSWNSFDYSCFLTFFKTQERRQILIYSPFTRREMWTSIKSPLWDFLLRSKQLPWFILYLLVIFSPTLRLDIQRLICGLHHTASIKCKLFLYFVSIKRKQNWHNQFK